VVRLAP
jgi:hypothetical protein